MLFNTMKFMVFFTIVFISYYCLPSKYQKTVLLLASYYFYISWNPRYSLLLLGITGMSYISAIAIENVRNYKKRILILNTIFCIGILCVFKYLNFMNETMNHIINYLALPLRNLRLFHIIIPIGISFYIFQTLSYLFDVYKGKIKAEYSFSYYALYVSFFPTISSGPIERASHLLPQLKQIHKAEYENLSYGLKKIGVGLFKKMIIADTLAFYVDAAFDNIYEFQGGLLVLSFLYSIQIYCDFSGYSDIAVGCARMLGMKLVENFRTPYLASSVKDFWKRWHISLSSWLTDYVYIPLGGSRVNYGRYLVNLIITFLISGLWHGSNWTFVVWGLYHGVLLVIQAAGTILFGNLFRNRISQLIKIPLTFLLIDIGWIFFRSSSISEAMWIIQNLFDFSTQMKWGVFAELSCSESAMILIPIILLVITDFIDYVYDDVIVVVSKLKPYMRWAIYALFIYMIYLYIPITSVQKQFIYFQF